MNLLPEENKIAYKKFYLKRLFVVFGASVFFMALSVAIVSLPGLLLILSYKNELRTEAEYFSKKDINLKDNLVATEVKNLNDKAKAVESSKNSVSPSTIFKKIIEEKNKGIKLTFFSYEKKVNLANAKIDTKPDQKNENKITISGIAQKRDDLIVLERQLKKQFGEDKVVSPVSNLINDKNLDFSISLYVKN